MKRLMTIALAVMLGGVLTTPVWAQSSNPATTHAPAKKTTHKKVVKKNAKRSKRSKKAPATAKKNG